MKKISQVLTLTLIGLLVVQPVLAEATKVEITKIEQTQRMPKGVTGLPEVEKSVKTFQVKPIVINGISYVSVKDLEKYMGVKWEKLSMHNGIVLETPVSVILIDDLHNRPQVNRGYTPCIARVKTIGGIPHVPAKFVFENMNSTVSYDTKTKLLTVNYYGEPKAKLVDTQLNTIKGYVKDKDGKPVVGAEVSMIAMKEDGSGTSTNSGGDNPNLPPVTFTDDKGYYEFVGLDTTKYPRVQVSVDYTKSIGGKVVKFEGYTPGTFDKVKGSLEDGFLRVNSKLEIMPVIYIYENIWD